MSTYALFNVERITKSLPPRTVLYSAGAGLCVGILVTAVVVHLSSASPTLPSCPCSLSTEITTGIPQKQKDKVFTVVTKQKLNWYEAFFDCKRQGLRFAEVESEEEQQQVISLIKSEDLLKDESEDFWLSGSDLREENKYVWTTSGLPLNYTAWYSDEKYKEPNKDADLGETELCLSLKSHYGYKWNDARCSIKNYYVCDNQADVKVPK